MRVDMHSHTHYSFGAKILYDGISNPEDMVAGAKRAGDDAIVITDHDTMKGAYQAVKFGKKYGVHVLMGEEITTTDGHMLAIDIAEAIKPHLSVEETIDKIHEQGGISISSHPFDIKNDGLREKCIHCDAVEVFNAINVDRIGNIKSRRFTKNLGKPLTAGSDAHCPEMLGHGVTVVDTVDPEKIASAVRKGRVSVDAKYMPLGIMMNWSVRRLQKSYDYTSGYMKNNYFAPKRFVAQSMLNSVNHSPGKIDNLFKLMTYISLGGVVLYGAARELKGTLTLK